MKVITFEDILNLKIDSKHCYKWVEEVLKQKPNTILPSKISMKKPGNIFCNVMPSIINDQYGGVKIITRYPESIPSLDSNILLFNAENGKKIALLDGNWITAMRTGAVAVNSIILLAKKDFKIIAFMGLGNTARATLKILLDLFPNKKFKIKLLRYKNQTELFIERFKEYDNIQFYIVDNTIDLVKDSDVIISCVTALENDVCPDEYFKEGVLVVPIHTRGFSNCDLFFDKVFADDTGHVCHFKYFNKFKNFAEVSDIINNNIKGRENNKERIIVYNIGLSIHDVYYASKIYEIIENNKINVKEIDLLSPIEKFWI